MASDDHSLPDRRVPASLHGLPDAILAEARAALESSEITDAQAVHDFRKAMKRWRSILRLFAPFLGEPATALQNEARDLAHALAGARDVRSAIEALEDLAESHALPPRSLASMSAKLEQLGIAAEANSFSPQIRERVRQALAHATETAQHWRLDHIGFADVAAQLARSYGRARKAIPDDWFAARDEELHELRKRVVVHRYQMELAVPVWPKLGRMWVGEAQKLRDRLGQHHDLAVMTNLTAPHQPLARWRSRLAPLIAARQRDHITASARLASRLFAEKPNAFRRRLMAVWQHRGDATEA